MCYKNKKIIDITNHYINILLKTIKSDNFIIILTDNNGCILKIFGDNKIIESLYKINVRVGTFINEENNIANAESLSIKTNSNSKHYIKELYNFVTYDSSINDIKGELLATLSLFKIHTSCESNLTEVVRYTSKIIESEFNKENIIKVESGSIADVVRKNSGTRYSFEDIIGDSNVMKELVNISKAIASSKSTILIEGESGTGKEVLAQSIHNYSNRKNNKFVAINCGAIPPNIIESELFGYDEGSFTGAKKGGKIGKFELANDGTLFLDEIGEMPLELQVHLLRVLQENKIYRVGSNKDINTNIRIIAATNKDLKKEIKEGRFREDLYYRLCVIPISLPPLRERKNDIEKLVNYFLNKKAKELDKEIPKINKELYYKIINYSWPGNIRQLENAIENIVNLNGYLSLDIFSDRISKVSENYKNIHLENKIKGFNLDSNEKILIKEAINKYDYNLTKTASILGISRNTLYNKIKKYKIQL